MTVSQIARVLISDFFRSLNTQGYDAIPLSQAPWIKNIPN